MVPAEGATEQRVCAVLNLHADHDSDRVLEREREEEVGLGEFASEDEDPETDRREALLDRECRVRSRERLRGEILARFARDTITEEATRRNDREEHDEEDGETELNDSDDESRGRRLVEPNDVDRGSERDGETDEEGDHAAEEVRSVVPRRRDVRVFSSGGEDLDERSDRSTERDDGPLNGSMRLGLTRRGVNVRDVVSLLAEVVNGSQHEHSDRGRDRPQ